MIALVAVAVVVLALLIVGWGKRHSRTHEPQSYNPNRDCKYRYTTPLVHDELAETRSRTHADRVDEARRKLAALRASKGKVVEMAAHRRRA